MFISVILEYFLNYFFLALGYSGASNTQNSLNFTTNCINSNTSNTCNEAASLNNKHISNDFIDFHAKSEPLVKPILRTYANKNSLTNLINNSSMASNTPGSSTSTTTSTPTVMSCAITSSSPPSPLTDQHESLRNFRKTNTNTFCAAAELNFEDQQQQILNSVVTTQASDLTAATGLLNTDHMIIFNTDDLIQQVTQQQQQLQQQQQQAQQQTTQSNQQQTTQIFQTTHWPQQIKEENDFCNNFVF